MDDEEDSAELYTMGSPLRSLQWSTKVTVVENTGNPLLGDKITLHSSALEQLIAEVTRSGFSDSLPANSRPNPGSTWTQTTPLYQTPSVKLPQPLTFRLSNPKTGRVVYAGVRDFSAEEGQASLSGFLLHALGVELTGSPALTNGVKSPQDGNVADEAVEYRKSTVQTITISAVSIPKGQYVKLRPMQAGYDTDDWKALLEDHLRNRFTTLTKGEILHVPSGYLTGAKGDDFELLVDQIQPEGDAICVVDTDLTCDVEALNEDQARETLRQIAERKYKQPGTSSESSRGGKLSLFRGSDDQVLPNEYVDYELPSWDRSQGIEISVAAQENAEDLDLLINPFGDRQRSRPRLDEHVIGEYDSRPLKRIRLSPTNVVLENTESLLISVHAFSSALHGDKATTVPRKFTIQASPYDPKAVVSEAQGAAQEDIQSLEPDQVRCKNCHAAVPQRSLMLHENFCLRNNILCPKGCGQVFQKRSTTYQNHWHCSHDSAYGSTSASKDKHEYIYHSSHSCPAETCTSLPAFESLPALATHRTSVCPSKLILCRFCHLTVPQEAPADDQQLYLTDLTPHEIADGNRTENCHLCNRLIRLREMDTHIRHHDMERRSRAQPRLCRNVNCGRTLDGNHQKNENYINSGASNDIGLCSFCFGPLYAATYDPDGKALRRRIERKYLTQMSTGCKNSWCLNEYCRTARAKSGEPLLNIKDTLPLVKPFVDASHQDTKSPFHFCTSEESQKRRTLAEMLAAEGKNPLMPTAKEYRLPWCIAAIEAKKGDLDGARSWLRDMAPTKDEEQ